MKRQWIKLLFSTYRYFEYGKVGENMISILLKCSYNFRKHNFIIGSFESCVISVPHWKIKHSFPYFSTCVLVIVTTYCNNFLWLCLSNQKGKRKLSPSSALLNNGVFCK